jgi:hypothetical protein
MAAFEMPQPLKAALKMALYGAAGKKRGAGCRRRSARYNTPELGRRNGCAFRTFLHSLIGPRLPRR